MKKPHKALAAAVCLVMLLSGCATTVPPEPSVEMSPVETTAPPTPEPTPIPTPEPTPEDTVTGPVFRSDLEWAEAYVAGMDETRKVYQLFVVNTSAVTGAAVTTAVDAETVSQLRQHPVGGFIYQYNNFVEGGGAQLRALIDGQQDAMRALGAPPLLTCVDEEGGTVYRLKTLTGFYLNDMYSYRDLGPETARANAAQTAAALSGLGLNTDFAPVADVWSNPQNTVIGTRAYSDSFSRAALLLPAAVEGFRENNVICTLKHFPGHGDTVQDSHTGAALVTRTLEELRGGEFLPFRAGIDAGADMVMLGHLTLANEPALARTPATFSRELVTLLREELGFQGVIITDSLTMGAAQEVYAGGEGCVRALEAGCDLLLGNWSTPAELEACADAVTAAVENGRLTWDRIDGSLTRILAMKHAHGFF